MSIKNLNGDTLGNADCPHDRKPYFDLILPQDRGTVTINSQLCFQQGVSYEIKFDFRESDGLNDGATNIDSVR